MECMYVFQVESHEVSYPSLFVSPHVSSWIIILGLHGSFTGAICIGKDKLLVRVHRSGPTRRHWTGHARFQAANNVRFVAVLKQKIGGYTALLNPGRRLSYKGRFTAGYI